MARIVPRRLSPCMQSAAVLAAHAAWHARADLALEPVQPGRWSVVGAGVTRAAIGTAPMQPGATSMQLNSRRQIRGALAAGMVRNHPKQAENELASDSSDDPDPERLPRSDLEWPRISEIRR